MILRFIDEKIRKSFSDAALEYDVLTSLHKEIGRELLKKCLNKDCTEKILDIGMGTGWLTGKLKFYFPESKVVGIDFSPGMIAQAKKNNEGYVIIQADANTLPFKNQQFDIVISNLALQWIKDLKKVFAEVHAKLNDDGLFHFTMFGHNTFKELFLSIERVKSEEGRSKPIEIHRLASLKNIEDAIKQAGFEDVNVDYELIKVRFPDMLGLVKWIKDIGANNLDRNFFIGKELLQKANAYYNQTFVDRLGVHATLEVIWGQARK
ncbi:MAG: methyltransferase domain-containing protein [Candidatus Omnitrophica bacterium]|nr:methyltransferase domain-containing protein [Candidatus Omnitrophota bacterium]MCB9747319.1 methyltransferase domain-containing protein [Candidatus Omnitrophota bacterium]